MNPASRDLIRTLRIDELFVASRRRQPLDFLFPRAYFRSRVGTLPPVPAYMYHQEEPGRFGRLCARLRRRGVATLTFGELLDRPRVEGPAVILSFDDGWSSVWSIVFPLAKRYGVRFTLFVVPALLEETDELRPTLDDGVAEAALVERDRGPRAMLTWGEVCTMHASGLVDVQSHSLHHGVVFAADRPCCEAPADGPFPLHGFVPLIGDEDEVRRELLEGAKLYPWGPSLAVPRRYLPGAARWESAEEKRQRYRRNLATARRKIEERLPGHRVRVLAPPWAVMDPALPAVAKETGHELIVAGYPFVPPPDPEIPCYPRLFGDAVWVLVDGPLVGALGWMQARRRAIERVAEGAVP